MRESGRHHSASSGEGGSSWVILNSAEESEDSMKNTICRITGMMALPAGEYRVQATHASPALLIQRTDGRAATFVNSNAVAANEPQTQTKLIFHRYGNRYFLAQVWKAGESRGRELLKSAQEKEQAVARNEAPDQVTIFARLISPKP